MFAPPEARRTVVRISEPLDPDLELGAAARDSRARTLTLVAVGGFAGGLAREAVSRGLGAAPGTFVVNVFGSFALALLVGALGTHPRWRPLLGAGLIGAFTTWSTFVVLAVQMPWHVAVAYVGGCLVAGLLAAAAGLPLGRLLGGRA